MAKGSPSARKSSPASARVGAGAKRPAKPSAPKSKAAHAVSPLAPKVPSRLPPLAGVRLATGEAGVRYKDLTDVLFAVLAPGTQVAGVFTTSKTASAPVLWCRDKLKGGEANNREARVLVVNSGNANAFTGRIGFEGVQEIAAAAAASARCRPEQVFMASTGVIGEPLP